MNERYMQKAVDEAAANSTPYGAVLTNKAGQMIIVANRVRKTNDSTQHAEIVALQKMAEDASFSRECLTIYSTGEPCPMCAGALVWAGIEQVYWGLSINELATFGHQIEVSSQSIFNASWREIKNEGGVLHKACVTLFEAIKK